ncbi:hypothetical protein GGS23DRAFT_593013 [Durotheca rogersii]|uniref:uncharacterized protein n=1 Tax=Durotheca rogersii TaxID=419775 RepID=UPI00221F075E|nr:uncharacterized protein GGS23DRAFT_593013 [Durotheca rogersii]KAI5867726.1 hypothetical protein GGS23DRAFT_593013 [Durotheca rogersii]
MAAGVLRLSRPWLASSRLSFPVRFCPSLHCSASSITATRCYSAAPKRNRAKPPSRITVSGQKERFVQIEANMTLLLPLTLVAPPIWRYPREPTKFFHMLWLNLKARFQTLAMIVSVKVVSQPKLLLSRPRFRFGLSAAVPAAKALHSRMSEALAVGDKETLRSICTPELFRTLAATIDSRPPGVRAEWQLAHYDMAWRYPRVADWRVSFQPLRDGGNKLIKQVVVSIASTQRITRYDDSRGGVRIAGSDRIRPRMVEHLVLQATVDRATYQSSPWKIWGTLPEMTYESYRAELENVESLVASRADDA